MASRLGLYNKALRHLGERKLASLTESREPRRYLDDEYDDCVAYCLEQGLWNFAVRSSEFDASASAETSFGYGYAFERPADWVRTIDLSGDAYFAQPLRRYLDENGFWYADLSSIFARYISNHPDFGLNLAIWPETFVEYVGAELGYRVAYRITQYRELRDDIKKEAKRLRIDARSKDAMNEPAGTPPSGTWVRSRFAGRSTSGWSR